MKFTHDVVKFISPGLARSWGSTFPPCEPPRHSVAPACSTNSPWPGPGFRSDGAGVLPDNSPFGGCIEDVAMGVYRWTPAQQCALNSSFFNDCLDLQQASSFLLIKAEPNVALLRFFVTGRCPAHPRGGTRRPVVHGGGSKGILVRLTNFP